MVNRRRRVHSPSSSEGRPERGAATDPTPDCARLRAGQRLRGRAAGCGIRPRSSGLPSCLACDYRKRAFRATLICQAFELATLAVLAVVGARLPDACVVPMISFVAAIQFTSFRSIGPWSFNSAMITANLRQVISGMVLWMAGRDATENRDKAIALSLITLFFLLGALCGGFYSRLEEKHALASCVAIVAVGFLLTWRKRRMQIRSPLPTRAVVETGSSQN